MKQFYVLIPDRLKEFGFKDYRYEYKSKVCMYVEQDTYRVIINSANSECIATICEMYKAGVIEILGDDEKYPFTMKVNAKEMKEIFERRKVWKV